MPNSKQNFIMTFDESTAKKLIAVGFRIVSQKNGGYLFLNQPPTNFTFEQFDKTKFAYTNMLSI
jgi:hypothetical protein